MTIGETIGSVRAGRGLSIDALSAATRIRPSVIRSIEADDFGPCGGAVYARGHLRSIGAVLGLDTAALVEEFDRAHGGQPAPVLAPRLDRATAVRMERRRPNWTAAMASVLVVVCVIALVHLLRAPSHSGGTITAQAGGPATASPSVRHSPRPAPVPSDALALVDPNAVTVQVRVPAAKSWVSVTNAAGVMLYQGVLAAGSRPVFRDPRQLRLVIGDAGAVDLVVNGRDLGPPGGPGAVVNVVYNQGAPAGGQG